MRNEELRATGDKMLQLLDELVALETRKHEATSIGSPAFVRLAEEVEGLSRVVRRWAHHQLELAREAAASQPPGAVGPRLVDVEARRLDRILVDWRAAEVRLDMAEPGSPEAERAAADAARLRDEYQAAQKGKQQPQGKSSGHEG